MQDTVDTTGAGDAFVGGFLAHLKGTDSTVPLAAQTITGQVEGPSGSRASAAAAYTTEQLQAALEAGCLAGACAVQVVGGSCTTSVPAMQTVADSRRG